MPTTNTSKDASTDPVPWASVVMPIRKCRATVRCVRWIRCCAKKFPARVKSFSPVTSRMTTRSKLSAITRWSKQWQATEIFRPGRGLAEAYNLGWRAARANYVFNMHSDCYPVDDNAMVRMVDWLEREGSLAVEPLNDIPQGDWDAMSFWDRVTSAQFRNAKPAHALMGKFDLFRRDALEKLGGFDEKRFWSAAEDADMVERLWEVGKISFADVVVIHAHQHPPDAAFVSALRKHTQAGEGAGALFRKYWRSYSFLRRAWLIVGLHMLKLVLLVGIFIPPISLYALALMLLLSIYYARSTLFMKDWRVVLIPFAVALMFSFFAIGMLRAFIRGRQAFEAI